MVVIETGSKITTRSEKKESGCNHNYIAHLHLSRGAYVVAMCVNEGCNSQKMHEKKSSGN